LQGTEKAGILRAMQEKITIAAAEEITLSQTALAFMSYVNLDDQYDKRNLTQFRERLSGEVRMQTGKPFDIFHDREDIAWGRQWQERITNSLNAVTFLIPIITPAFFKNIACRAELELFLKREEAIGYIDLILPVYYVNCPVLDDNEMLKHDPLAQVIMYREYYNWLILRHELFTTPHAGGTLAKMMQQIAAALIHQQETEARLIAKIDPPTVVVDARKHGDYTTITQALEAVQPGTRILVRPGLYKESIVVDKQVEIIGDGERSEIVIEGDGRNVILFQANNGRIANLTICQTGGSRRCAVTIAQQGRLDLEDCDISSQGWQCVAIYSNADPWIRRCHIHDSKGHGVVIYNGRAILVDNEIYANVKGGVMTMIIGNLPSNPIVRRNRIYRNGDAELLAEHASHGLYRDNYLCDNADGA
jgi:hypothetical protein